MARTALETLPGKIPYIKRMQDMSSKMFLSTLMSIVKAPYLSLL
jgi:hypothetical protein